MKDINEILTKYLEKDIDHIRVCFFLGLIYKIQISHEGKLKVYIIYDIRNKYMLYNVLKHQNNN